MRSDKPCCSIVPLLSMNDNLVPPSNDVIRVDDKIDDVIRADDKIDDVTVFDDDDAAVILEELALNFGVYTRAPSRGSAALLSVLNKSGFSKWFSSLPKNPLANLPYKGIGGDVSESGKGKRSD
ncbi:hypothetical protein Avbf_08484 [Armadillidium vulgare]|nr:hypothetical protein Avbf_08484 [Armadillidium vulgare]